MKFKVKKLSYLFGELIEAGQIYDYPDDKLPLKTDGSVDFSKMSQLEPLDVVPVVDQEKALPDESKDESKPDLTVLQKQEAIVAALQSLDKNVDANWTTTGLPRVEVIESIVGFELTRQDLKDVAPDFVRPAE